MADTTITFPITGMTCANCASNIERALRKVEGVQKVNVNFAAEEASLSYDDASVKPDWARQKDPGCRIWCCNRLPGDPHYGDDVRQLRPQC